MNKRSMVAVGSAVVIVGVAAGAVGWTRSDGGAPTVVATARPAVAAAATGTLNRLGGDSLERTITGLQAHLTTVPQDYPGWATLGLAYVQQAKVTVNSDYYPKADGALARSLSIDDTDNFLAHAGLSALASARHDFATAEREARAGLAMNPSSPILYGALGDALVQLGRYDEADTAIATMVGIRPDTTSLARQSYLRELRGDVDGARRAMTQALDFAPTPADRAFALFYLGELDFNGGDANAALARYREALAASPTDVQALGGKAKAEAALGQYLTAVDDYTTVVARAPEPGIVLDFADLLASLGRTTEADAQYKVVRATQELFRANGVEPDATLTFFEIAHGNAIDALSTGEAGLRTRPFVVMQDAYAWALHANGRDQEARTAARAAIAVGLRSALFHYHAGMIEHALGNDAAARDELTAALQINPHFSPVDAPIARHTLDLLGASA